MNLNHLTDKTLINDTKKLAHEYRKLTNELLHHLAEIDKRKLYTELGYSCMFNYVVKELGFSESSATRRIKAARLLIELPQMEEKMEKGTINLTTLSKAIDSFKQNNIKDSNAKLLILSAIENKSTSETERSLIELTGPIKPPIREIKPLSQTTNLLSVELTDGEIKLYKELKALVRQRFWTTVLSTALQELTKARFKTSSKGVIKSSTTRFIPASLKRAVYERDRVCTKCGSKSLLEYDHIRPYSLGGKTELNNLRIMCRACNLRSRFTQNLTSTYHRNT